MGLGWISVVAAVCGYRATPTSSKQFHFWAQSACAISFHQSKCSTMQLDKLDARSSSSWPRYRYGWKESFDQKGLARAQMSVSDYLPQVGMRFFGSLAPWLCCFCLGFLWRVNLSVSRVALILFRFVVYKFAFRFGFVLLSNCVNTAALRLSGVLHFALLPPCNWPSVAPGSPKCIALSYLSHRKTAKTAKTEDGGQKKDPALPMRWWCVSFWSSPSVSFCRPSMADI